MIIVFVEIGDPRAVGHLDARRVAVFTVFVIQVKHGEDAVSRAAMCDADVHRIAAFGTGARTLGAAVVELASAGLAAPGYHEVLKRAALCAGEGF